jgi:hypothetical protein
MCVPLTSPQYKSTKQFFEKLESTEPLDDADRAKFIAELPGKGAVFSWSFLGSCACSAGRQCESDRPQQVHQLHI